MDKFVVRKKRESAGNSNDATSESIKVQKVERTCIKKIKEEEDASVKMGSDNLADFLSWNSPEYRTTASSSTDLKSSGNLPECMYKGIDLSFEEVRSSALEWKKIKRENLDLDYTILFPPKLASAIFRVLEEELEYFTGELAKVKVFGKWHDIPRKQTTYGDSGLTYRYSGTVTHAKPWPRPLEAIRDLLMKVTGQTFNFVLVNRYKDGSDRMGEHKDDEKDLDRLSPIASITLGQPRDFYFKHQDARGQKNLKVEKERVNLVLENGSLLLMNYPTNNFWYHALPPRKSAHGVRINLTFRKIIRK